MSFIKKHWFGMIAAFVVAIFFVLFVLILISPRQDLQKRGFIPCTEALAEQVLSCEKNKIICMLSATMKNSWCDMKVVGRGFSNWVKGKQPAPWSNYIFEPELPEDEYFDDEARKEYLKHTPDIAAEMQNLKKLSEELENENIKESELKPEDKPTSVGLE